MKVNEIEFKREEVIKAVKSIVAKMDNEGIVKVVKTKDPEKHINLRCLLDSGDVLISIFTGKRGLTISTSQSQDSMLAKSICKKALNLLYRESNCCSSRNNELDGDYFNRMIFRKDLIEEHVRDIVNEEPTRLNNVLTDMCILKVLHHLKMYNSGLNLKTVHTAFNHSDSKELYNTDSLDLINDSSIRLKEEYASVLNRGVITLINELYGACQIYSEYYNNYWSLEHHDKYMKVKGLSKKLADIYFSFPWS